MESNPMMPAGPYQRHAVAHHQIPGIQNLLERGIMLRFHHAMHSRDRHVVAALPLFNPLPDLRDSLRDLHGVNPNSQQPERRYRGGGQGNAQDLNTAIQDHGGEATQVIQNFNALSPSDQADLIAFISSL